MGEKKIFLISYEVDTGYDYISDSALVFEYTEEKAIEKIKEYIETKGREYFIHEIFSVEEFHGDIFTSRFNYPGKENKK